MKKTQTTQDYIFSFQPLPPIYENAKNEITAALKGVYSDIKFNYIMIPLTNNEMEKKSIEYFIFNQIKDFKFMVYEISDQDININSISQENLIICAEKQCFIISSIDSDINIDFFDQSEAFLINSKENEQVSYEADSFCKNYYKEIKSNVFVKLTIHPLIAYLIRRHFYPSEFFVDQSFLTFYDKKSAFEEKYKTKVYDFILKNDEKDSNKFLESFSSFSNQIIGEMKSDKKEEKNQVYEFTEKEFIKLRTIFTGRFSVITLVIHIKTLYLFIYKEIKDQNNQESFKNIQHEIDFCSKYCHRCLTRFYGFVKDNYRICGEIYEFMSNSNLDVFVQNNKANDIFNIIAYNRIFQGIDYLHSNSLIHRDLRPFNILVDNDNIPYIADYDTVRSLDPKSADEMTEDIGEDSYASPEQQTNSSIVSFPTDIYSFGQIIYFLYEKKDSYSKNNFNTIIKLKKDEDIPKMMNASDDIQSFVKNCISFEQEKRPKRNEIILFIGEQLNKKLKESFNERKTKEMLQFFYEFVFFKFKYSNNILETAKSLFVKENYSSAKKYFDLLVDFKVPDAYFYMARFYQYGYSVPTNLLKAVEYFKLGSDFDDYKSNFILGQFYFYGIHGEKDIPKAIEYFQKSAKYFAEANYIIGGIYWEIYKDREKSMKYLKEAAAKNHLGAISSLGGLCLYDKDYDKAIEYFETAAKQNHLQSIFYLGVLYYSGTGFDKNYQKAREYFEIAAKQNDGSSYLYLGIIYENGFDVTKDFYKAKFYYEKAVEFGRLDANCNLGTLFYKGDKNIDPNFSKAKKYFEISVEQENPIGFLNLGLLYFKGEGVEKDYSKAKEYFELSAEKENISAFIHLGIIYLLGKGVVPDYQKSYEYFQKAADKENAQSFYYLGMLFENGFGVNINIQKTIEFYQQSAAMYYNTIKVYDNQDPDNLFFVEEYENNFFFYPSINNLGLIYLTELGYTDQDLAGKYLQKAGLNEYPFGQNNWGLFNQFFMKNINEAEYFFNKAATIYSFALSEYNLGYIHENVNNDFEEAIKHYKKALEYMNLPLIFHGNVIIDKRLQVSKSFVACFINLKLAYFSLLKDESQSNNEAKEYFINSIFHILFTLLLDDLNDSYEFEFKLLSDGNGSSLNLKDFFFNFPLFKFSNQINKSCSDWKIFEMNSNNKSKFRVIVIRCQRQNDQQNNEKILDNLMSSIGQIKISKICDGILTKDNNNNPNDFPENESEEIQQNLLSEPNIKESIENIFSKMNTQKFFILMDNLSESNLDDSRLNGNDSDVIFIKSLENSIERYLKYPKCLCQIFFRDIHHLKNEISNIIDLMNNILYTPPYSILFGRIQIKEKESK